MAYVPPKYPGAIPTAEDLPNRTDDVDWMFAARYNELKKELRAALIELGTDPAGTFATVKARLDAMLPHFHDRGDPVGWDWTEANLTTDGVWHDLDLSSIVPAGAKAVLLGGFIVDDLVGQEFKFRKNGNSSVYVTGDIVRTQVANVITDCNVIVACDTNRVIEYRAANIVWSTIRLQINGWWK